MDYSDYFDYIDGKLFWKIRKTNCVWVGKEFGAVDKDGYVTGRVDNKLLRVHRIIWEMHNGPIPNDCYIDHIDHVRTNNSIENLRVVTPQESAKNIGKRSDNTSGIVGVCWHKRDSKWKAYVNHKGKHINLGYYDTIEEAAKVRSEKVKELEFHKNHGK